MEIKIDRYTKIVLTLIALGLFANAFKSEIGTINTPLNPQPAIADNIGMGSALKGSQPGQRFITTSPDGKTVYYWFREEDAEWYDRDKVVFVGSEQVKN